MGRVDNKQSNGKVAVLMGGWSAERDISLQSGAAVLAALKRQNVDAFGVDVGRDIAQVLSATEFSTAFVMLHGRGGEDGVIQGLLETMGKPYTGSGILGSSVCMDKLRTKQMWMGAGLRTPPFYISRDPQPALEAVAALGWPVMVKPIHEGSSIGISRVERAADLAAAWESARRYDEWVLVEKFITGVEYTVGILGQRALPMIALKTPHSFFDYDAKYCATDTVYQCPCGLSATREAELKALALLAFGAVGASGWGRVDFILDRKDVPWLIEVNTIPGMTDHSLVPMAARAAGMSFDDLVMTILAQATLESKRGKDHG